MPVIALDTHAVVKELQAAGFTEAQAEAVTRAVRKGQEIDFSDLATKADLAELRQATKADIAGLRHELDAHRQATKADIAELRQTTKADIAELKADLLKWVISAVGLQTLAVLGTPVVLTRILQH
ncbi:coiled-coil domain-containing protein [Siccirubricoccus phaeus]|uniref:coiled-coil domain-containing protein n=1 Tax=Siccirubricoccus phaeus TaxID=2595053 RepID=UPI0011F379B0|nr:coiled-coil domain-containing protein [Siccirubricoccus phaeus]